MAALEAAIQSQIRYFRDVALDGRVKPGHDDYLVARTISRMVL